jgi:glycosyltransferase involved in cell wall biosynthesis
MAKQNQTVCSLLLVRNGVENDARVLRAARVAERALAGRALVVGVATATAPAGATTVEGVAVLRLPARTPGLTRLAAGLERARNSLERISRVRSPAIQNGPAIAAVPASGAVATGGRNGNGANGTQSPAAPAVTDAAPSLTLVGRVRRILSGLSFSWQALSVARQTRPRLVHANDWNTMWTGLAIKLGCGARLIYDSHELWADRNGRWEWRPWLLAGEALFMRAADEVITSSPGYADVLASRYRVSRPMIVRNIPERGSGAGRGPTDPLAGPASPPRVVYVGGLMPGRGLEQMIDSLALLPDVRLYAIGPGTPRYRMGLLGRARAARVEDRVVLRAPVAPSEVHSVLRGAAAGLCLIQPICRSYELSLPNKLFEYAAAGVPVLASDAPVIAGVVHGHGLGEVVATDRPRAIAASLTRLLAPAGWTLASERARAFAVSHDWTGEADTLTGVYGRAVNGGSA